MNKKMIYLNDEARAKIKTGINTLANVVGSTLGPKGRPVILQKIGDVYSVTKDGVSVAKEISLPDPVENAGVQLAREAAARTNASAGDGTTTATILADAIYSAGIRDGGSENADLKSGLEKATEFVVQQITNKYASPITADEEIHNIAKISANGDESIASAIAEAFKTVGVDGVVTVEESTSLNTTIEKVEGTQLPAGYASPYFINSEDSAKCIFDRPAVCITDSKVSNIQQLMPILEAAREVGMPPVVIIAEDFSPEVLATMVINKAQGLCNVCAVKLAIYGESRHQRASDLAIITGSTLISEQLGTTFETFAPTMFGRCAKTIVTSSTTTIIDGAGNPDEIAKLRTSLTSQIEAAEHESFEKIQLTARLNYVKGGVAVIKVGAATSAEMKEKRDRVDDAINAVRAAIMEGTVPGGGSTFIRCAMDLREHIDGLATDDPLRPGMRIIERALSAPITRLFNNARIESKLPEIIASIKNTDESKNEVYDIRSSSWGSAYDLGLIDPAAVLTNALINASSIATLLLTTNAVVVTIPEEPKQSYGQGMPMM